MKWLTTRRRKWVFAAVAMALLLALVVWSAARPAPGAVWVGQPYAEAEAAAVRAGGVELEGRVRREHGGIGMGYRMPEGELLLIRCEPDTAGEIRVASVHILDMGAAKVEDRILLTERVELPWSVRSLVPQPLRWW